MCYSFTLTHKRNPFSRKYIRTQSSHFIPLAAICLSQSNLLKLFIFYYAAYLLIDAFGTSAFHQRWLIRSLHVKQTRLQVKSTNAYVPDTRICVNLIFLIVVVVVVIVQSFGVFFIILFSLFYVSRVAKHKTDEICIYEINGTTIIT